MKRINHVNTMIIIPVILFITINQDGHGTNLRNRDTVPSASSLSPSLKRVTMAITDMDLFLRAVTLDICMLSFASSHFASLHFLRMRYMRGRRWLDTGFQCLRSDNQVLQYQTLNPRQSQCRPHANKPSFFTGPKKRITSTLLVQSQKGKCVYKSGVYLDSLKPEIQIRRNSRNPTDLHH